MIHCTGEADLATREPEHRPRSRQARRAPDAAGGLLLLADPRSAARTGRVVGQPAALPGPADVIMHRLLGGGGVVPRDGLDDRLVFLERQRDCVGRVDALITSRLDGSFVELLGDVLGQPIAGDLHERVMKDHIRLPERVRLRLALPHSGQRVLQPPQFFRAVRSGHRTRHRRLEAGPYDSQLIEYAEALVVVDQGRQHHRVQHVPVARRPYLSTPPLRDGYQTLLLQPLHRLTQHRAAHAEVLAQRSLRREQFTLLQLAGDDEIDEFGDDSNTQPTRWETSRDETGPATRVIRHTYDLIVGHGTSSEETSACADLCVPTATIRRWSAARCSTMPVSGRPASRTRQGNPVRVRLAYGESGLTIDVDSARTAVV